MLLEDATKEVLELEWSPEITSRLLLLLPRKQEFFLKIGSQQRVTALSWKGSNSENLLEVLLTKELRKSLTRLLEIWKIS